MKVSLTMGERTGIKHVLANIEGISLEGAMHVRALETSLKLDELSDEVRLATVKADPTLKEYAVEEARVEWLTETIRRGFENKKVHPLFAVLVLNVYENLSETLKMFRAAKSPEAS